MRIINANAEYIDANNTHPYQLIERAGRTCYKSENNITEESSKKFVHMMVENKHTAMLEHAHIYMTTSKDAGNHLINCINTLKTCEHDNDVISPYLNITKCNSDKINENMAYIVSGSFRTFLNMFYSDISKYFESKNLISLKYILNNEYPEIFATDDTEKPNNKEFKLLTREECIDFIKNNCKINAKEILKKHIPHTVIFTCDRGVSHEFVRHRPASFAQESTRYCNYSKDKFGNEITVIKPYFFNENNYNIWKNACENAEKNYFSLIENKATPQEARSVLPNSLKTEIIITATEAEWQHIINLRYHGTTGAPHPQIKEVMAIAYPVLKDKSENRLE